MVQGRHHGRLIDVVHVRFELVVDPTADLADLLAVADNVRQGQPRELVRAADGEIVRVAALAAAARAGKETGGDPGGADVAVGVLDAALDFRTFDTLHGILLSREGAIVGPPRGGAAAWPPIDGR
jgi:hypothetical protein